ncbi:T9SS type A sorting domain-containing protein [Panacibacter ginsenosidivorans]|nr:T9SS type A sorting domain-containing protein [Panacibacter ginsenosidivorans]
MKALIALCSLCWLSAGAQTDTTHYKYGVWQSFGDAVSATQYPEVQGRLANFRWADMEPNPDQWNWTEFDSEMTSKAKDGLPIIFLVYTKEDAPDWLYSNGVPKVTEKDDLGNVTGYSPYYEDPEYKTYFKRMILRVHQHLETLPDYVRKSIIGVQPCFGSTGDYISYKGNVSSQYALSDADFYALFQEFTMYYYDEYRNTDPKIYILSNPNNSGDQQTYWLMANCPGSWIKTGTLGKGYQLNNETDKAAWLYDILNKPVSGGTFMRARSELIGGATNAPWWNVAPYKNMFTVMGYAIHWGLDWSNQAFEHIDDHNYDDAFTLYNKYAGYKDPATSNNAMCMLKDALDAADGVRFPASQYGTVAMTATRYNNVLAPYISYGAKLEDLNSAMGGEMDNIAAKGTNDVGWKIFPGNYERFLHQINPNETSVGYWNVTSAEPNTVYGRFARGFDLAKGKDALYFDVEDAFLHNAPLDAAYPVAVEITYLDRGTGKWQLFYDAKGNPAKGSIDVTCTNTNKWKKVSVTLSDAYFGNMGANGADLYIKNMGSENVIFTLVELSRSSNGVTGSNLFYSGPLTFDTVCVNSTPAAQQLSISGQLLNSTAVTIGPLQGFSFATTKDGTYSDSLIISGYGAGFSQSVYVKFNPTEARSYTGALPVSGGGASKININISATAINSSPDISSSVINTVSCYNQKDGSIDLKPLGGQGPFTYSWVNNTNNFKSANEDISALIPSTYTVTISAAYNCKLSQSFIITQPDVLVTHVSADPMLCKGSTTNVYVTATGGTMPYTGTGTFVKSSGFYTYTVKDKNGCSDNQGFSAPNGTLTAPAKPGTIQGATADLTGVCVGSYSFSISSVSNATSYLWTAPSKSSIATNGGTKIVLNTVNGFNGGALTVAAVNACGTSNAQSKTLKTRPAKPGGIVGPQTVTPNQKSLVYSTAATSGLTYTWSVPASAKIVSGQNTPKITVNWGSSSGKVKVAAKNDCATSYNTVIDVTVSSSLTNLSTAKSTPTTYDLTASPNPARSITTLSFNADVEYRYSIVIYDMTGKVVVRKSGIAKQGSNSVLVSVASLKDGLYSIAVINNDTNEKITTKLVKG